MPKQSVRIPVTVICNASLSPAARVTFGALAVIGGSRAARGQTFAAPMARLEEVLGRCGWSVTRRIRELEQCGYVRVQRPQRGQLNKYRLMDG